MNKGRIQTKNPNTSLKSSDHSVIEKKQGNFWDRAVVTTIVIHVLILCISIPKPIPPKREEIEITFVEPLKERVKQEIVTKLPEPEVVPPKVVEPKPPVKQEIVEEKKKEIPKEIVKPVPVQKEQKIVKNIVKPQRTEKALAPKKAAVTNLQNPAPSMAKANPKPTETFKVGGNLGGMIKSLVGQGTATLPARVQEGVYGKESFTGLENGGNGSGSGRVKHVAFASGSGSSKSIPSSQNGLETGGGLGEAASGKKSIMTMGSPSETVVVGSIDGRIINEILQAHKPQFSYCYQVEIDKIKRNLDGKVDLHFVIGADGSVIDDRTKSDSSLEKIKPCIANVLRGIKFPMPKGGGKVEVSKPLSFESATI